ncbi:MAG: hypothetical protein H7318_05170 [Oligoflexus sp.]|nr:hypothetical protein [Oligoflexus sp.]
MDCFNTQSVSVQVRISVSIRNFRMPFARCIETNFEPNNLAENDKSFIQEIKMLSLKNATVCLILLIASDTTLYARSRQPLAEPTVGNSTSLPNGTGPGGASSHEGITSPEEVPSQVSSQAMTCYSGRKEIGLNNEEVISWSDSTKNGYHSRGHISGTIIEVFHSSSSHKHISVQIGATEEDAVEVIYNEAFGHLPVLAAGMSIEACGDYITSTAQTGWTPASPDRGVIHWVHSSSSNNHDSGFVILDGQLYGDK